MNNELHGRPADPRWTSLLPMAVFMILGFLFFFSPGRYVLVFQESQSLFLFTKDYFEPFLAEPGGLLRYGGAFLTQLYADRFLGAMTLAVILTLPALLLFGSIRRSFPDRSISWLLLLLPSCALFVLQLDRYHRMEHNLGLVCALLFYLLWVVSRGNRLRILALALLPIFSWATGAFAVITAGLCLVHTILLEEGRARYLTMAVLSGITAGSLLLLWLWLLADLRPGLLLSPLPTLAGPTYNGTLAILAGLVVFFPVLDEIRFRFDQGWFSNRKPNTRRALSLLPGAVVVLGIASAVGVQYDSEIRRVVELEHLVHAGEWEEAIELQERSPVRFRVGEYLYNVALSETGQLCDRLFSGPQDFGPESLFLPWAVENLSNGSLFHYAVGLTNEGHRWAFEDMVTFGKSARNLKMLARTSLLNGDFALMGKYTHLLQKTLFYRKWARDLQELADRPERIEAHPSLAMKAGILPERNFFVQYTNPERTLSLLFEGQPDNRRALEYLLAGGLLAKNLEFATGGISRMEAAGYDRIPRHLEEAALLQASMTEFMPDLGGLTISSETQSRFERFLAAFATARRNPTANRERMREEFGDTYWFYYFFS